MASTAPLRALHSTPRTWPLHFSLAGQRLIPATLQKVWCYHLLVTVTLTALTAMLYIRTLHYPLVFDDQLYLDRNAIFKDAGNYTGQTDFYDLANRATEMHLDVDISTNFLMRPLVYLTFFANYSTTGMDTAPFRWVNMGIHLSNALLLYSWIGLLLTRLLPANAGGRKSAWFIASATALLFLVHPLQTESVTYVVQRFTSMGTLFYLLILLTHLLSHLTTSRVRSILWRVASCAAFLLGSLSKETVVTAPLAVVLIDWWLLGTSFRSALARSRYLLLFTLLIPLRLLIISWCQNDGVLQWGTAYNIANSIDRPVPAFPYCLSQLRVLVSYLQLVIWPTGLHVDHHVALSTSLLDWRIWVSFAALVSTVILARSLWRRAPADPRSRLIFGGVIWFLVTALIPVGIVPLPDAMADHRVYLPSMFLILGLVCGLDLLRTRASGRALPQGLIPAIICAWIAILVACTNQRNEVWSKSSSLWRDSVTKSPGKARAWYNLAMSLREEGKMDQAVPCLEQALRIDSPFELACLNLGAYQASMGEGDTAIATYERGVQLQPKASDLLYNLGVLYYQKGWYDASIDCFNRSVRNAPYHCLSHRMLGKIYINRRQYDAALRQFRIAEMLTPNDKGIHQTVLNLEAMRFQPGGIQGFFSLK